MECSKALPIRTKRTCKNFNPSLPVISNLKGNVPIPFKQTQKSNGAVPDPSAF